MFMGMKAFRRTVDIPAACGIPSTSDKDLPWGWGVRASVCTSTYTCVGCCTWKAVGLPGDACVWRSGGDGRPVAAIYLQD